MTIKRTLVFLVFLISFPIIAGELVTLDHSQSTIIAQAKATGHGFEAIPQRYECAIELGENGSSISKVLFQFHFVDLTTGKEKRDKEMLHWLEADTHPDLVFSASKWSLRDGQTVLEGDLTFHGVTKPVSIVMELDASKTFHAKGYLGLNTTEFGLKPIKKFMFLKVDPVLHISLDLVGTLSTTRVIEGAQQ